MIKAYTYLIGWSQLNKWYYGCRYAKNCNPSDLWVTYKTSSSHVHKFVEQHGEPDVVQIRKVFTNREACKRWERKVLKRMHVVESDKWLNKNDSFAPPILIGKKNPWFGKSRSGDNNPMFGKKHKLETIEILKQTNTWAKNMSKEERKEKFSTMTGRRWFNNGTEECLVLPEEAPTGFVSGRKQFSVTHKANLRVLKPRKTA